MDTLAQPTSDTTEITRFPVDNEHGGLRLVVVVTFLASGILSYVILSLLIPSASINLLGVVGALVIAYGLTTLTERTLKRRWPSGRALEVDASGVRMSKRGVVQQTINAEDPVLTLYWHFQTRRRSRIPKGWHVLSLALQQDDRYLVVYTFVSPDQFKKIDRVDRFKQLQASKDTAKTAGGRDALLLAGEQRRLMDAEARRYHEGGELSSDDFIAYLRALTDQFPEWMR